MDVTKTRPVLLTGAQGEGAPPSTLREATQAFESLFVSQVVKAMRRTVPESGLMGEGNGGQRLFREMLDDELSKQIASTGGFGIGEILHRQLSASVVSAEPTVEGRYSSALTTFNTQTSTRERRTQDDENR